MPTSLPSVNVPVPVLGVRPDLPLRMIPEGALSDAQNWLFREGGFRVRAGLTRLGSSGPGGSSNRVLGMLQYDHSTESRRIIVGTQAQWYRWNETTDAWVDLTDGSDWAGAANNHVIFRAFTVPSTGVAWVVGCNGQGNPKKWDGDAVTPTTWASIGGSPPVSTKSMCISGQRLIILYGKTIDCSAYQDFDSGYNAQPGLPLVMVETSGDGVALMEMGNHRFYAYKTDAIYAGIQQAGTYPFRFEMVASGIAGPASPASVVQLPDGSHLYLARDGGVYRFSGQWPEFLGNAIRDYVAARADVASLSYASGWYDSVTGTAWFVFPTIGNTDPNAAIAISVPGWELWPMYFGTNKITCGLSVIKQTAITWSDDDGIWSTDDTTWSSSDRAYPRVILGDTAGKVYENRGTTDDGTAIPAYFETGLISDGPEYKTLTEVDHLYDGSGALTVRIGVSNGGETRTFAETQAITVPESGHNASGHRATGRGFTLRSEVSASAALAFNGARLSGRIRGKR